MTAAEIAKTARGFLKDAQQIDKQHDFQDGPADFEVNGETINKGTWVIVTKASNEIWEQIKKDDFTGYSMTGTAETIEKQKEKPFSPSASEEKGLFNLLKKERSKTDLTSNAAAGAVMETDPKKIREALQDFVKILRKTREPELIKAGNLRSTYGGIILLS